MNKGAMAWMPWIAASVLCATTLSLVGERAMRPAASQVNAAPKPPDSASPGDPRRPRRNAAVIDAEWPDAQEFLRENAPHYEEAIRSISASLPDFRKFRLEAAVINRVQTLKRLKEHFPELYEVRLEQLRLFDNLFDTHRQYASAGGAQKEKLREQIKQEVGALVDNAMKDRQKRIARLQEMLGKLNERAEKENQNRDAVVEKHLRTVLDKGVDTSLLDGMYQNEPDGSDASGVGTPRLPRVESHPSLRPTTAPAGE